MKTYTCDICKKEFGKNVTMVSYTLPYYQHSDFIIDGGFYNHQKLDSDVCIDCYKVIAKAQEEAIELLTPKE